MLSPSVLPSARADRRAVAPGRPRLVGERIHPARRPDRSPWRVRIEDVAKVRDELAVGPVCRRLVADVALAALTTVDTADVMLEVLTDRPGTEDEEIVVRG